jgi:hypothetical protein
MLRIVISGLAAAAVGLIGGWTLISLASDEALSPTVEAPGTFASAVAAQNDDTMPRVVLTKGRPARPSETPVASQPVPVADPDQAAPGEPVHKMRRQKPRPVIAVRAREEDDDD